MVEATIANILNESERLRRALIKKIEEITGTCVVSYLANPNVSPNFIDHNDPIFFNDLLEKIGHVEKLDLILDSPGGEANMAEKLAIMCRDSCDEFRAIIPNSAKSAATMLAITSDKILMGYLSEIGPIDPQIKVISPQGQITFVPAQSIIDSVGSLHTALQQGIDHRVVVALIQKLDPPLLDISQKAIAFSQKFAEDWLSKYMLKENSDKAKETASALSDNRRWLSHGKIIGVKEAQDLGLNVEMIDRESELWKSLWEYYCRAQIHLNNTGTIKLFECGEMALNFGVTRGKLPSQEPPK